MKSVPLFGVIGLSTLLTSPAFAQPFYDQGEVSVALERVFGVHYEHEEHDNPPPFPDFDTDSTVFGLGWYGALTPLMWARGAVDVFVIDQLSVGGSLAFFGTAGDDEDSGVLFAPRVGYAIPLSKAFTFWPRGGVTFYQIEDRSLFGISAEAMFVASPQPSWGILFGPTIDLGFVGDDEDDEDFSEFVLGIPTVGLMGTF